MHRAAQDRTEEIRTAGDGEQDECGPERRHQAEPRDRRAPRAGGERHADPCRRTCDVHPEKSEPRSAPAYGAAYRYPTVDALPPKRWSANAGKSALGMPKTIAFVSTRKIPING